MNPRGDLSGPTEEEPTTGYLVYVFPALTMAMRSAKAARGPLSHFEGTTAQFYIYLARTLAADRAPTAPKHRSRLESI